MLSSKRQEKQRIPIVLACSICGGRNFKTTRGRHQEGILRLKKFCPACGKHTEHVESR
ncbi:MAG: 50S ribosomal protein L33 [Sorangiineae bacterium NIC37A_2]|nr:MAG: 50S ribosomal protein L33 [Sorangiineae bacterium NIC37A_2]